MAISTHPIAQTLREWIGPLAIVSGLVYGYGRLSQQLDSLETTVIRRLDTLDARLWELRGAARTAVLPSPCPADQTRVVLTRSEP